MDELGKLAWFAIAVVAFWTAWPLGLAVLAFLAGHGRLRAWRTEAVGLPGRWFNLRGDAPRGGSWHGARVGSGARRSGNAAFDAYRENTLRRLEEEQREFQEYLERLRRARDKAEFDQFMTEQRRGKGADTAGQQMSRQPESADAQA